MMNKNMNSPTKLTEFAPLSPQENQPVVASLFSKFFNLAKNVTESPETDGARNAEVSPSVDDQSSSGESGSWRGDNSEKTPEDSSSTMTFNLDASEGRSLPNVLRRISNIVALKSNNLKSYKDSHLRSYWMPDKKAKQCYECCERFTTFRRRHHCRVCGQIFCSKCCSDEIPGKIMGCTGDLRVCTYCCKVVLSYLQSSDMKSVLSADLKALQEDLEVKYGGNDTLAVAEIKSSTIEDETRIYRKTSVGYMEEKYAIGTHSGDYLTSHERSIVLKNSASLRIICQELFRSNKSIPLETHRVRLKNYYNCFTGNQLVNWMISQNKAATRIQATAIGQALFQANYIESMQSDIEFTDSQAIFRPVSNNLSDNLLNKNVSSCDSHEPAWVKNIPQHDSTGTDSESESKQSEITTRIPSSGSSFYLDLDVGASTVTLKRPTTFDNFLTDTYSDAVGDQQQILSKFDQLNNTGVTDEIINDENLKVQQVKVRNCWHKVNNLCNSYGEMSAYNNLSIAYKQHEEYLIKQLLNNKGLSSSWAEVILPLAHQIIDQVRPNQNHDADDMDIRQYVQIKKSPGGTRDDCEILSGVFCSKNVAHRAMNAMIAHPKILLLQCGLMYQRVEGKLLSLEPVMLQEKEYLGHTVARIMALKPDIVMVHRSVARLAQDRFRECGVTLILNVKLSVMERVARCTGATIVNTIDAHLTTHVKLGTCQKFYLRNFPRDNNSVKTIMYFESCANSHLGSGIHLRGGSLMELKKVKNVMSTVIFAAYSWRLEKSFLMDEFAKPPSPKDYFFNENFRQESDDGDLNQYNNMEDVKLKQQQVTDDNKSCFKKAFDINQDDIENKLKFKDNKVLGEEKRSHGESISDLSDPLHQYLNEQDDINISSNNSNNLSLSVADLPLLNKFKKSLDGTILSFSPYLKFTIPYLETESGRNCVLRKFFPKDIFYSPQFIDTAEGTKVNNNNSCQQQQQQQQEKQEKQQEIQSTVNFKSRHPFTLAKLTAGIESRQVQALIADFRARGSRLNPTNNILLKTVNKLSELNENNQTKWPDCLDPLSHQRLAVLFCSFSHNANNVPAFCVNPWIVNMDLYGRNDIALGRFLERYCLTSEYKCPAANCRAQIVQHARRFAHDSSCIHITLKKMSADPFGQENSHDILMWSKCIKCKNVSPVVPMSSDTWSLSYAKYLELRFYNNAYTNRSSETCVHSLHHDYNQYFSRGNMLAIFKYMTISLWEISLPPPVIHIIYDAKQHINVIEEMKNIALKGDEVFSSIKEKLMTLQLEQDALNAAKQQVAKEQQYFKNKIEEVQLKLTSPTLENTKLEGKVSERQVQTFMFRIEDGLVILKRLISEAVSNWNDRINDITTKKKDQRSRKFTDRSLTAGSINGIVDTDGYITEDTASESLIEDLSPMSADYNAIEAISAVSSTVQSDGFYFGDMLESSDNEIQETSHDVVVVKDSPKSHHRSYSDVLPVVTSDDMPDRKKKKKTILSQLLPSTTITTPIYNPLGVLEHHLLPLGSVVPIVVYESEPSSIIAYALDSHDYKHALQEIIRTTKIPTDQTQSPLIKRKLDSKDNSIESDNNLQNSTVENEEESKTIKQHNYIQVQFADSTTNFYCRIYFAAQFAALRDNVLPCGEDGFTRSLCRSVQWAARGGKSGSTFSKSRDDRFILKELSRVEMQIFLDFAPNYFAYMEKCQQTKQPTLLGKIVGVYRVSFKNNTTNAALRTSVLVMENLFYSRTITDKYDLKGSVRNRLVNLEEADQEGELVLLDENLLNMSCDSPLYIRSHSKSVLNKAIEQDTKFLADNSVMDYSLLVGLEPESNQLVLGIIDYIRTFTWDKKLETMVKKSGILGGQGKLPTIVSPEEYRARFIAAMHRYFLPVPDRWTGLGRGVE
ncbi:1-phosphatidylinositol 3-phosphate 5-kinase isoform X2 [Microplitis demolitor]|uniref:1-phosphatidylinositol 3-phosphate 5-kinase isoform X2 n=1 Tax=Microplitis demolitor TaxID=69319 RepID=UPI0004CCF8B9|nr:1-phosphatidylinositol 3-phosphate 5-kinase isoform X2 [Microplitis demolitor]